MKTIAEFAADAVKGSRDGWYMAVEDVEGVGQVGIKAHGKWIQRMEYCGITNSSPHGIKTQRAMRQWIIDSLEKYR